MDNYQNRDEKLSRLVEVFRNIFTIYLNFFVLVPVENMATITFGKIPVLWGIESRIRKPKHLKQQGGDLSEWTSRVPFTKITAAIEKAYVNFILSINKWVLICYI